MWEGALLLAMGVWNLESLGHLKVLPEADLHAQLLLLVGLVLGMEPQAMHLLSTSSARELHAQPQSWVID